MTVFAGPSRALLPTSRSGADPAMDAYMEAIVAAAAEAAEVIDATESEPCQSHASEEECMGALIVLALARRGLLVVECPAGARTLLAQQALVRGRGARA